MCYRECPYCGANLDPGEICDCQGLATRDQYLVEKRDGKVHYDKNEGRVKRSDRKRERPAGGYEGFL